MSSARRAGDLCIVACAFCADATFRHWVEQFYPVAGALSGSCHAKEFILKTCGIASRKELDTSAAAAELFHRIVRRPFLAWKEFTGVNT